jgi:hypothetical protein
LLPLFLYDRVSFVDRFDAIETNVLCRIDRIAQFAIGVETNDQR